MQDNIILVSEPDDVLLQGFRILLFDLDPTQGDIFTKSITTIDTLPQTIVYSFTYGQPVAWLIDKLLKCQLIIFNAESHHSHLVGYISANRNSYYFGELRDLSLVNKSVIYGIDDCREILTKHLRTYG